MGKNAVNWFRQTGRKSFDNLNYKVEVARPKTFTQRLLIYHSECVEVENFQGEHWFFKVTARIPIHEKANLWSVQSEHFDCDTFWQWDVCNILFIYIYFYRARQSPCTIRLDQSSHIPSTSCSHLAWVQCSTFMYNDFLSKPYDCFFQLAQTSSEHKSYVVCPQTKALQRVVAVKGFGQTWQSGRMLAIGAALWGCLWVKVLVDTSSISALLSNKDLGEWGDGRGM